MSGVVDWVFALPLVPAIAVLWVIVFLRAGATYMLGRGAHRVARRGRVAELVESPKVAAAIDVVNRWGAPVVSLSFLTVGFQTAVNFSAGLTRMPYRFYVPALAIGGFAWAVLYATVGLAAIGLWLELFLRSPWAALAVLVIIAVIVGALVRRRRRHRDALDRFRDDMGDGAVTGEEHGPHAPGLTASSAAQPAQQPKDASPPAPEHRPLPRSDDPDAHTR
ncbi:MAG: VTT domain-containing protein [Brachybacterium sp.]|nr:VTT domain-containing protein [Brachybacterium sp.]